MCMPCRHVGEQRYSSTHFHLSISCSSRLCASTALPVQKTSPLLVEYGAGWAQELVRTFSERKTRFSQDLNREFSVFKLHEMMRKLLNSSMKFSIEGFD